jgi:hypothetical protein
MKKTALFILAAFVCVLAGTTGVFAAAPEKVVLNAKPGNITFPHQKHAETLKIACKTCHHTMKEGETAPAKCTTCHGVDAKAPKAQDAFHKRCQGCHKTENETNKKAAPTKCTQCHVKA